MGAVPEWSRSRSRRDLSAYVIRAAERVEALAPRDFIAVMILAKNWMSIMVSSSVHQFGGDRLGKFASLQAYNHFYITIYTQYITTYS